MSEILGVGTPLLDHLLHVKSAYLNKIPGEPYGMETVSYQEMVEIIENSGSIPKQIVGGSSSNAIKGLTSLGHKCSLTGKLGKDAIGEKVLEDLQDLGITPKVHYSNTPTGHVTCLITPDGKRTCRAYLGAGGEMGPDDLDPAHFENCKLVHIEGYSLLSPGLTHRAMEYAKDAGAEISFDLASFEIVENYKDLILNLVSEYVTILFANEDETATLTGKNPKEGCDSMRSLCDTVAVMMGEKGCYIGTSEEVEAFPAFPVKPVDTTGAGDLFAAGFLHGYLLNLPFSECARYGAITGGQAVQIVGAEIPQEKWSLIKKRMQ